MAAKLKPYPAMKDSGVPWLWKVPDHWVVRRGKWLFQKMDRPVRDSDEVVTCFRDGKVTLRKNRRVRGFTESLKEIGYQGIRRGDLVIHAMDSFAGAIGVSDSDGKGTPVYSVCEPSPEANSYYYAYILREMARSQWIQALAKGIRERSTDFRFDDFGSLLFPLPPISEQAAIVRFLDNADRRIRRYIRAKQLLVKLLEEQKQAIIHHAVTRGLDPGVPLKPSGVEWLGDVPEHWIIVSAKQVSKIFVPQRDKPELNEEVGLPWVTPECVGTRNVEYSGSLVSLQAGKYASCRSVPTGSVIASCVGRFGVASINEDTIYINQQLQAYVPTSAIDARYLRYMIKISKPYFEMKGNSTTLAYVNRQGFSDLPLVLPSISEQLAVVSAIEAFESNADMVALKTNREISLLQEYRARLISDVVTGKLDVRGIDLPAAEDADVPEECSDLLDSESVMEDQEPQELPAEAD